ncbi:hypothetical protein K439DRAFT_1638190 [Ramaria rubella]|nr:hypothetical protein K439DRAFT_1638190 [Ramaria rubella]
MDMFEAASPLVAFLVLGTTRENLAAVAAIPFRCKKSQKPSIDGFCLRGVDDNRETLRSN